MIVDDEFMAIGLANMQSRSMPGIDSDLQVAMVDDGGVVARESARERE
jgi:hypothetical protein